MSNTKLKPCPFCGGEAEMKHPYSGIYLVGCKKCNISTTNHTTKSYAMQRWNTRKPMDNIVAELEEKMVCGGLNVLVYNQGLSDAIDIVKRGGVK